VGSASFTFAELPGKKEEAARNEMLIVVQADAHPLKALD
jgi:hypothetical protein